MKFVPRRDLWLSIVIGASIVILIFSGLSSLFVEGAGLIGGSILFLICMAAAGFMAWLWIGTSYMIQKADLIVRTGPITKAIPLDSITKDRRTRSWMASAATSSRRLEISYGKYDFIHLSPLEEDLFLSELRLHCPQARIE